MFPPLLPLASICATCFGVSVLSAQPANPIETTRNQAVKAGEVVTTREAKWTDDVRTRDVEIRRESDGVVISRYGKVWRSDEIVSCYSWSKVYGKGARWYYHNGRELLCEADEDGDGVTDIVILFDDSRGPVAGFAKKGDGTVLPLEKAEFEAICTTYEIGKRVAPLIDALGRKTGGVPENTSPAKENAPPRKPASTEPGS